MQKKDFLAHWASLTPNQSVTPRPIPYKHEGSTYTEDSIRLTGTKEFVDSVLSRLQDLLANETGDRRLGVVYKESMDRVNDVPTGSYNVYIQVHERGGDAAKNKGTGTETGEQSTGEQPVEEPVAIADAPVVEEPVVA